MADEPEAPTEQAQNFFHEKWRADIQTDYGTGQRGLRIICQRRTSGGLDQPITDRMFAQHLILMPYGHGDSVPPMLQESFYEQQDGIGDVTGFVQAILDAAYDAGMRPSHQRDSRDELKAVRYHLEDMRVLAFGGPKP